METQPQNKLMFDTSTQTDPDSNKGEGFSALDAEKHAELFTAIDSTPIPEYRMNLVRVLNEEFIAEKFKKDLSPIIDLVLRTRLVDVKESESNFS